MKKKDTLVDLLDADWNRAAALLTMQQDIEAGDFMLAMESQLHFLYWDDEVNRLLHEFNQPYWDLHFRARGLVL